MNQKVRILKSKFLTDISVNHGFTERTGGVSSKPVESLNMKVSPIVPDEVGNVARNLEIITKKNEQFFDKGTLLYLEGGSSATQVDQLDGFQTLYGYDGVVTKQKRSMLAITVADCLPILLVNKKAGVIGISHAGWKGSAGKITTEVVNQMVKIGANTADIVAVIGPGICKQCYEVGEEIADKFSPEIVTKTADGRYLLDLVQSNIDELKEAGVNKIEHLDVCTYESTDRLFSARKDERTGRFLAYISLDSA